MKIDGWWIVVKPMFGFRTDPDATEHASFQDAVASMTDVQHYGSAGGQFTTAAE